MGKSAAVAMKHDEQDGGAPQGNRAGCVLEPILGRMKAAGTVVPDRSRADLVMAYEEDRLPLNEPDRANALRNPEVEGGVYRIQLRTDLPKLADCPFVANANPRHKDEDEQQVPRARIAEIERDGFYKLTLGSRYDHQKNLTVPLTTIKLRPGMPIMLPFAQAVEALRQHGQFVEEVPDEG